MKEVKRQIVHISGVGFVAAAQLFGKISIAFLMFCIAFWFLVYSLYLKRKKRFLKNIEEQIEKFILGFERESVERPMIGAFWFFLSSGFSFYLLPLAKASAIVMVLSIGDGLSTLIGYHFGKHRVIGKKTLEGCIAGFLGALSSIIFVNIFIALHLAILMTMAELTAEMNEEFRIKGILDDNWLIPLYTGLYIHFI